MTIHVLNDVELWFAEHRLRGFMNAVALNDGVDVQEVTVFGDAGKRRIGGLHDSELSAEGFFDSAIDKALYDNLALNNVPVTIAPRGSAVGDKAYLLRVQTGEYSGPNGAVGEPAAFSLSGAASSGTRLVPGFIAHNGVETVDGVGTAFDLGSLFGSLGQLLVMTLHVVGFTNANPTTIYLESDDDVGFATPTIRHTFSTITGVGAQFAVLSSSVPDNWWRVRWDVPAAGGPSINFVAAFGIQSKF